MAEPPEREQWLVVTVEAPSDALKSAVAEGLVALGGAAVQETGDEVTTYIAVPADIPNWLAEADASLRASTGVDSLPIRWRVQDGEDWTQMWKRGLGPRRVGRRFIVAPSWTTPSPRPDDLIIVIDPEMAFGTGEHATTRAALRFLEASAKAGDRILDVGTGSGILAIGAAQLGAAEVIAVDNDADALLNARDNIERNRVTAVVTVDQRTVDARYLAEIGAPPFDIIVANVLSSVLLPLLPAFWNVLRAGGLLILGGLLEAEADDVLAASTTAGFEIMAEDLEEEWWGVLIRRPPAAS